MGKFKESPHSISPSPSNAPEINKPPGRRINRGFTVMNTCDSERQYLATASASKVYSHNLVG